MLSLENTNMYVVDGDEIYKCVQCGDVPLPKRDLREMQTPSWH